MNKNIETFKQRLIDRGVYKGAIISNDWINCPQGKWYVTIPYGRKNGGRTKIFTRFSDFDVESAVGFWFDNVDRNAVFTY